jgi:hypothetical protein
MLASVIRSINSEPEKFGAAEKTDMAERSEDIENDSVLPFSFGSFSFSFYTRLSSLYTLH